MAVLVQGKQCSLEGARRRQAVRRGRWWIRRHVIGIGRDGMRQLSGSASMRSLGTGNLHLRTAGGYGIHLGQYWSYVCALVMALFLIRRNRVTKTSSQGLYYSNPGPTRVVSSCTTQYSRLATQRSIWPNRFVLLGHILKHIRCILLFLNLLSSLAIH